MHSAGKVEESSGRCAIVMSQQAAEESLASDGTRTRVNIEMRVAEGVRSAEIPQRLAGRHNQLLEQCLADVKKRARTTEKELKDSVRRDLLLEIERERAKARRRAEEQRKELELEIER